MPKEMQCLRCIRHLLSLNKYINIYTFFKKGMYFLPVNPWLHVAMGNGPCCMASWWSLLSCGEISEEEDCESERGDRRNGENRNSRGKSKIYNTVNTESYTKEHKIILPSFCYS